MLIERKDGVLLDPQTDKPCTGLEIAVDKARTAVHKQFCKMRSELWAQAHKACHGKMDNETWRAHWQPTRAAIVAQWENEFKTKLLAELEDLFSHVGR